MSGPGNQRRGMAQHLFVVLIIFLPTAKTASHPPNCKLSYTKRGIFMPCAMNSASDLIKNIANQNQISSLKLSNNNFTTLTKGIFQNFTSLQYLYLDHNLIKTVEEGAFWNLKALQVLDLSYNKMDKWSTTLTKDLLSLQVLNLDHNNNIELKKTDLDTMNYSITGVNVAGHTCKVCNLTKVVNVTRVMLVQKMLGQFIRQCIYYPDKQEDFQAQVEIEKIRKKYVMYQGTCMKIPPKQKSCDVHVTSLKTLERYFKDRCYRGARALRPIVFVAGSFGFILNLFVVSSILILKRLRYMVPFLLVAHLSFCDFLTAVYAIGTASGHEVSPDFHDIRQYRESNSKCAVFWVIFLLGQTLGVLTCLLVTVERFLATVYCMKPAYKLEARTVFAILPVFWVLALLIALPLQLIDYKKITINFMCVLLRDYSKKKGFFVSQGLMIAYLILYIIVVALYCRIYIFVRKSSRQVSVKREAKLAKRIGLIVFTNFVCFALPNLSMLIFTTAGLYAPLDDIPNTIIRRWVPPMFLVLNACANPCFFAFGNKLFASAVKQAMRRKLLKWLDDGAPQRAATSSRIHPIEMKTASTSGLRKTSRVKEVSTAVTESHT